MSGNNETIETLVVSRTEYDKCVMKVVNENSKEGKTRKTPWVR